MRTLMELFKERYWIVLVELLFSLVRVGLTWWEAIFERSHAGGA